MSVFVPKVWKDGESGGTPITAEELNRVEAGIARTPPIYVRGPADPDPTGIPVGSVVIVVEE